MESDKAKSEEDGRQSRESLERIIDDLQRQNAEQRELFHSLLESWRADCKRHQDETINAIRSTANEQVPFNVQGYLDEFSKAMAGEVRMLLSEVGRIREEKRALQYEIGALLSMKAMYGPGGEFEPDWKPRGPPGGTDMPPPPMPNVSRMRGSWAAWEPDRNQVVTPPSVEPTLIIPGRGSPGLFGTPSESTTDWKSPGPVDPSPGTDMPPPVPDVPQRRGSWATWEPDRNQVATPPVELIPGLGKPSESSTDWASPRPRRPPPVSDMPPPLMPDMPQIGGSWAPDRNHSPSVEPTLVIPGCGSSESLGILSDLSI